MHKLIPSKFVDIFTDDRKSVLAINTEGNFYIRGFRQTNINVKRVPCESWFSSGMHSTETSTKLAFL